ncbi:MAG: hypothetical protein U1E73_12190 [Planctomycetota bacterium]
MARFRALSLALPLVPFTFPLPAQNWHLRQPAVQPGAAILCRMAFDMQRGRAVLFGGWAGANVFDDTWEWDGTNWLLRAPATRPPERDDHALAYDQQRGRTVLFGGEDLGFAMITETWEWDGTNWAQLQPATVPHGRLGAPMCYDTARGVTVLFGGTDWSNDFQDTWEWNGTDWSLRTPAHSPSARGHCAMAYDIARGRCVLFGGESNGVLVADTWEWDGVDWTQVATDGAPSARTDHTMVYDPTRQRVVMFGGADLVFDLADTWEFDGSRWFDVTTSARPAGSAGAGGAFDTVRGEKLVFGGYSNGASSDFWTYGGNDATFRTFGTGCPGSNGLPPRIAPLAVPALGGAVDFDVADLPGYASAIVVAVGFGDQHWGNFTLPLELTPYGLPGCRAYTSADAAFALAHQGGSAHVSLPLPNNPAFAGLRLYYQCFSADPQLANPAGGTTSNAGEATLR